jgi:hypothetical protein
MVLLMFYKNLVSLILYYFHFNAIGCLLKLSNIIRLANLLAVFAKPKKQGQLKKYMKKQLLT